MTASPAMPVDSATCRLISLIDADNSSVADATVWTLVEASSETDATVADLLLVCSAVADIECAVVCSSVDAVARERSDSVTDWSNAAIKPSIAT